MLFRDTIDLLELQDTKTPNGFRQLTEISRITVFANKKSIRSSEFYLASQNGYALELMFEVRTMEYGSQKYLDFDGKRYLIIRTYDRGEITELTCQLYTDKPSKDVIA
jgi:SPP1 family predicted phage head-tail adaptor